MNEPIILSPTMFVTEEEKKTTEDEKRVISNEKDMTSSIFEKSESLLTDDDYSNFLEKLLKNIESKDQILSTMQTFV